jgi:CBS-domain-containing membrane protein
MRGTHPPRGATALAAVIGSEKLHGLGYAYVLEPIFLNVVTILAIAVIFNALFKWRRYPAYWGKIKTETKETVKSKEYNAINHDDFVYALSQIDTYVDIDEDDLLKIYALATKRHADIHAKNNLLKKTNG